MASSSSAGVPPGFRFHPTDEELLLYYLKKKVSFEKFDLEVVREIDLNKVEPWDLQERCRIGSTPQSEWYFFSHKDRKYPTGSRTNRATNAGFWKATGRDKCIRTTYRKIGMRKTLVFYRGRAPHGKKTDWIMHEYRLEDSDEPQASATEDGWVICRVFKKKCFFKTGAGEESSTRAVENHLSHDRPLALTSIYTHQHHQLLHHHNDQYLQMPAQPYSHVQVQDLLPNHRPGGGYDFAVLPNGSADMVNPYACEPMQHVGERRDQAQNGWAMIDTVDGRFGNPGAAVQQMNHLSQQQRNGGEMDLWGYGK